MKHRVAIVKTDNGVKQATKQAIQLLGGIDQFIKHTETVLLKPNLFTTKGPETGATTDMRLVLATAELLKQQGNQVIIGECPAMASYARPDTVFEELGVRLLCEENNIPLKILDRDPPVKITVDGVIQNDFWFPETATKNPIISFPKLKTHALTTMTCAVKNLFGLQQGGSKAHHHVTVKNDAKSFSHLLLDIYDAIRPQVRLHIVDAHIAMEGEGPTAGTPIDLGLIIAGEDAVAVDLVAAALMDWDPMDIGTNLLAGERGLGPRTVDELEVVGEPIDSVKRRFKKPEIHSDGQQFIDIRMPIHVDAGKCTTCGICEQVCPAKAITMSKVPQFNYDKCIQCFCCVELCPQGSLKAVRPDE